MRATAPARSRPAPAARVRPGERPSWWNAALDREHFAAWRAAADGTGLTADALVCLLVELDLVLGDLRDAVPDPHALLAQAAADGARAARLGPATELRDWLAGPLEISDRDELPELLLSQRVAARLTPGCSLAPRIRLDALELALSCDRQAARAGRTLESWALQAALAARALP